MEESEREQLAARLAETLRERGHGDGEAHHAVVAVHHYADHVLVDKRHVLRDVHLHLFLSQSGELMQDYV